MIKLKVRGEKGLVDIAHEIIQFPGGERHVRITSPLLESKNYTKHVVIEWLPTSSNCIMDLLLMKDALTRNYPRITTELHIQYMPYARQDRVANFGEALSVKVVADLINGMKFDTVVVYDPHSDITPALLERCVIINQLACIQQTPTMSKSLFENKKAVIVAPDNGATKKALYVAMSTDSGFLQGLKYRDTKSGALNGFGISDVPASMLEGADIWLVDDICDGGGTFLGLVSVIKALPVKPASINLYVTHGIFSKGVEPLLEEFDSVVARFDWSTLND